jgi:glutathione S-transferase
LPGVGRFFPLFVKLLAQSGSGFFAKSGVTYVDFVLAEFFTNIRDNEPKVFEDYPELVAHIERVNGLAQLQEYLRERKN